MQITADVFGLPAARPRLYETSGLGAAIDAGFARAWPSIRDSNISTMITCAILYWFGSNFGASIIKGFALTLALGVIVSMFSAITITRTLLRSAQLMTSSDPRRGTSRRVLWLFGAELPRQKDALKDTPDGAAGGLPTTARQ